MRLRSLFYKVHLYVGIVLGGFFLLLGLTGSILVFYPEIDLMLHSEMKVQQSAPQAFSIQAVLDTLRAQYPTLKDGWRIEMPLHKGFPIFARYSKPKPESSALFAPLVVSIDPSSLQVTSARIWGDYFVTWIYDLHYQLLLGETGKVLIVLVGLLLIIDLLMGLYLWFPKTIRAWRHALVFKISAHSMRINYDIHKLVGVFGFLLIVVLAGTGALLGRPSWFNPLIHTFSTIDNAVPTALEPQTSAPISADEAAAIAQAAYPHAELRWIYTPNTSTDYYQVRIHQANEPGRRFPKTILWINPYSGSVVHVKKPEVFSAGDTILAWLHPLHSGEAFGMVGRILVVISGILIVMLCWTGFKRTLYKQKVKRATTKLSMKIS